MARLPVHQYPSPRPLIPFETWLDYVFSGDEAGMDWDDYGGGRHVETRNSYSEYLVWTWEDPHTWLLERYSLDQICEAFRTGEYVMYQTIPNALNTRAWQALWIFFSEVFEPNVSDALGHRSELSRATKAIDRLCYMWWDQAFLPGPWRREPLDDLLFLEFCRKCLASPRPALQESAIHGLGHSLDGGQKLPGAKELLTEFVVEGRPARPELVRYAKKAMKGRVM